MIEQSSAGMQHYDVFVLQIKIPITLPIWKLNGFFFRKYLCTREF